MSIVWNPSSRIAALIRLADELGFDLRDIPGSGVAGTAVYGAGSRARATMLRACRAVAVFLGPLLVIVLASVSNDESKILLGIVLVTAACVSVACVIVSLPNALFGIYILAATNDRLVVARVSPLRYRLGSVLVDDIPRQGPVVLISRGVFRLNLYAYSRGEDGLYFICLNKLKDSAMVRLRGLGPPVSGPPPLPPAP